MKAVWDEILQQSGAKNMVFSLLCIAFLIVIAVFFMCALALENDELNHTSLPRPLFTETNQTNFTS